MPRGGQLIHQSQGGGLAAVVVHRHCVPGGGEDAGGLRPDSREAPVIRTDFCLVMALPPTLMKRLQPGGGQGAARWPPARRYTPPCRRTRRGDAHGVGASVINMRLHAHTLAAQGPGESMVFSTGTVASMSVDQRKVGGFFRP